ncbi:MAG: trans-aconitate 2-methyltransferase [Phycisphaerales bacterium]
MSNPPPTPPSSPPVHEAAARRDWPAYFDRIEGKPPRQTLLTALANAGEVSTESPPLAVDLGCGSGRDTLILLEHGYKVWAQDSSQDGLQRSRARKPIQQAIDQSKAQLIQADFQDLAIPNASLVNASFSLPFCPPAAFDQLWESINDSIQPGGRFCGQFFGDRDDWAILEDRTHLTRAKTISLFDQYILESFTEEDRPSEQPNQAHKHWHVFHVVARKLH